MVILNKIFCNFPAMFRGGTYRCTLQYNLIKFVDVGYGDKDSLGRWTIKPPPHVQLLFAKQLKLNHFQEIETDHLQPNY